MIFYNRVSRRRYTLFRQVLFVLQAVPDILDIVVVLQGIQQLAHCLELIGVGQTGGVMGTMARSSLRIS